MSTRRPVLSLTITRPPEIARTCETAASGSVDVASTGPSACIGDEDCARTDIGSPTENRHSAASFACRAFMKLPRVSETVVCPEDYYSAVKVGPLFERRELCRNLRWIYINLHSCDLRRMDCPIESRYSSHARSRPS